MPAADIGHARARRELLHDTVERRQPRLDEVGEIAGPEEPFGAREQIVIVLVPAEALARAKALGDLRLVLDHRRQQLKGAGDERGAVFVGQRHRLLGRQPEGAVGGVVLEVAAGGLLSTATRGSSVGQWCARELR